MKWRNCNLGANVPEGAGLYFSWGNVNGHPKGSGYDFSIEAYALTPGALITNDLSLTEDAANAMLGSKSRIPSISDLEELNNYCTSEWININGVNGRLFTSTLNGESIFIPACGRYNGTVLSGDNTGAQYWTASYVSETDAHRFDFDNAAVNTNHNAVRRYGMNIRPVFDPNI